MNRMILALAGVFIIALAIAIGSRLSNDAMAVIVGIVCGIGASIPTSLLMLFLLDKRDEAVREHEPRPAPPAVVIVNQPVGSAPQPQQYQQLPPGLRYQPPAGVYYPGWQQRQIEAGDERWDIQR
jgi:hypothetical protein